MTPLPLLQRAAEDDIKRLGLTGPIFAVGRESEAYPALANWLGIT